VETRTEPLPQIADAMMNADFVHLVTSKDVVHCSACHKAMQSPYSLEALDRIERIIDQRQTRWELYKALRKHEDKTETLPARKHGLIPL
jgi:acetyl-CoA carboxylase carboxyltransferase component